MAARVLLGLGRAAPAVFRAPAPAARAAGVYQSQYSLDKLYPAKGGGDATEQDEDQTQQTVPDIPVGRLSISYCRSSGPGGQNVNKVNSKAEVRFHLASADWIPEDVRQKIAVLHKNKISKSGDLIINSEVSRYQMRNRADCLQKIRDMILESTEKPQVKCKETSEMLIARVEKMNRERLRQKRLRSALKRDRSVDFD